MVVGDVRPQQLLVPELLHCRSRLRSLEFRGDAKPEPARQGPVRPIHAREHPERYELVIRGEKLLLQTIQILRPLVLPSSRFAARLMRGLLGCRRRTAPGWLRRNEQASANCESYRLCK